MYGGCWTGWEIFGCSSSTSYRRKYLVSEIVASSGDVAIFSMSCVIESALRKCETGFMFCSAWPVLGRER